MPWTIGSISVCALDFIQDETAATTALGSKFAELSVFSLNNFIRGLSLGITDIDDRFAPALVDMTAAKILGSMTGIGADFSYSLGDLRVDKGQGNNSLLSQQQYHLQSAIMQVKAIEKPTFLFQKL